MVTSFVIVSEQGMYNFVTKRFDSEPAARKAATKLWCCWVLYRLNVRMNTEFDPTTPASLPCTISSLRALAPDVA